MDNDRTFELLKQKHLTWEEYKEYYGITTNRSLVAEAALLTDFLRTLTKDRSRAADFIEVILGWTD